MTSWLGNLTLKIFSFRRNDMARQEHDKIEAKASELVVIGSGFGRTGTASLKTALETLLNGQCYHMIESFKSKQHPGVFTPNCCSRNPMLMIPSFAAR